MSNELRKNNYQPNKLTLSNQSYSIVEKKIFAIIVNQINHNAEISGNMTIEVSLNMISKYISYAHLKKASKTLNAKQIGIADDKKGVFKFITPFPEISYNENDNGLLKVTIYEGVVPLFKELGKEYTKYQLMAFLQLDSIYSQRFYEILSMHLGRKEKVVKYTYTELQNILEYPKSYSNYEIDRQVIKIAQKEIIEKTGIHFTVNISKKVGKKAVELQFTIQSEREYAYGMVSSDFESLAKLDFSEKHRIFQKVLNEYPFNAGLRNAILSNQQLLTKFIELDSGLSYGLYHSKTNPIGYVAQSIRNEAILLGIEINEQTTS